MMHWACDSPVESRKVFTLNLLIKSQVPLMFALYIFIGQFCKFLAICAICGNKKRLAQKSRINLFSKNNYDS